MTTNESTQNTTNTTAEGTFGDHTIEQVESTHEQIGAQELINPQLGLDNDIQDGIVKLLTTLLADEYLLYTKTRKYHWNVTGPQFISLHEKLEEQYEAIAGYVDETAERIRQYGALAIGTLQEFKEHSRLQEHPGQNPDARSMVADLVNDHEMLIRCIREDIETIDDEYDDVAAEDYLTVLLQNHQKHAWMLRSLLEGYSVIE